MLKQIIILGQIEHRILFEHQNLMDQILNIISSSRKYSNIIQIPKNIWIFEYIFSKFRFWKCPQIEYKYQYLEENIRIFEYIWINLQKNVKILESKIFVYLENTF